MLTQEVKAFIPHAENVLRLYKFVWFVVISVLTYFYSETEEQELENVLSS